MSESTVRDTHNKALEINLDASIFGSFAEIGAGQEVARWFLHVGAASGTVAKTVSAYDKEVSDDIYGTGTRYVSRDRLQAMLDKEWDELRAQVSTSRGGSARLFTFANTVAARNYAGTNECHGWMGIRFQDEPGGDPCDVLLHVNMRDDTAVGQQAALGILGVNLVWAVFRDRSTDTRFLATLFEGIAQGRLEVDFLHFTGAGLEGWDAEIHRAETVRGGYAEAVFFPTNGPAVPPTELLHKKPVVIVPGIFRAVESVDAEVMQAAIAALEAEGGKSPRGLFSGTISFAEDPDEIPPAPELRRRIGSLPSCGSGVLLYRARELYRQTAFVNRFTAEPVRFAVSIDVLVQVLQESQYGGLEGRLLEGVSRLLAQNVRLYVYPMTAELLRERLRTMGAESWVPSGGGVVGADGVRPSGPLRHLYQYLLDTEFIRPMEPLGTPKSSG